MKTILLTQGRVAIVDDEDYDLLMQYSWQVEKRRLYAVGNTKGSIKERKRLRMHRLIMDAPADMQVDHINGDGLDNRKCNLRICSNSQNMMNGRKRKNGTSKYKGVSYFKRDGRWRAVISNFGKYTHIGYFDTEEEAAMAYNEIARNIFGEFAWLNVI